MALTKTTIPTAILLGLLAIGLGGCGVIQWFESLGEEEDSVPVTSPTRVDANAAEQLAAEPGEPEPDGAHAANDGEPLRDDGTAGATNQPVAEPAKDDANAPQADPNEASTARVVSGVSLRVNNEFISPEEIIRYASGQLAAIPKGLPLRDFRRRAAEVLGNTIQGRIHTTLVLAEARKKLTEQHENWIKAQVADHRRSLVAQAGSVEKLREDLRKRHTTLKHVLKARREQLQYQIFLQDRFESAIVITRRKLLQYYRTHEDEFASTKRVQFRLITIPVGSGEDARSEAKKTAKKAVDEIAGGRSFAEVAKDVSKGPRRDKGGLWPKMGQGELAVKPVDKAIFSMKEGQLSDVIETDSAMFIVKVVEVDKASVAPFEEAQKSIAEKLREKQRSALHDEYYSQLYEAATIQRSEEFLTKVLQLAEEKFYHRQ
jgi:parvulin-like peptidyl-prolyl isomerase